MFDLSPTDPLPGLHLRGTVTRRFLITYPVPVDALAEAVPPGAELLLHDGTAWVSACFVHISDMRPSPTPSWMGLGFNYLIHRTLARLPYPDGKLRPSVLILEANINRPILGLTARTSTGVRFRYRKISLSELSNSWVLRMSSPDEVLYEAEIFKDSIGTEIDKSSRFASASQADRFLLGVSFGGQWEPEARRVRLLAETHEPWTTLVGRCKTSRHALLRSLDLDNTEADNVITMTAIPHYFALRGITAECPSASTLDPSVVGSTAANR